MRNMSNDKLYHIPVLAHDLRQEEMVRQMCDALDYIDQVKKYVLLDPLGVVTKTRSTLEDTEEGLADAPSTIVQREELNRQVAENYFFVPGMGNVPEIAVPDFLPDLLGVADDLSYSAELGPSIAPSVPGSNIPGKGPKVFQTAPPRGKPPRKPPPPKESPPQRREGEKGKGKPGGWGGQTWGGVGGDLMGDLAAKLSLRRKGISGTSINTSSSGGSATDTTGATSMMQRMSSIIPPPPNPTDTNHAPSEDWD
ncbi:hypothetical protein NP493_5223g00023 [Ridgeia piscesae]|uniref:WASH1 WAHD domain-containing protein n=1 Tax=Ridgeia piscesae TaxID=27915 RepID=A0AAD9IVW4_RIDPI|nr:hypothetical protein NP493_5223g00023 [Ridgeia piscesae]